jgi:hypothetical protein
MSKYRHFTTQELQYIRENYGRLNHYGVAENLGRSPSSVLYHVKKMGLAPMRDKHKDPIPDTMPMSEADIVLEWDQAANKPLQIRILADLNCVTQKKIKSILQKHGREIPKTRAKQTIPK